MKKVLNFLKRNVVIHIGVGIWLGVMGALYVIYSNAEVSSGLSAGSVAISKTNIEDVPEATLQSALDYLYGKAALVGQCPEEQICMDLNNVVRISSYLPDNDKNTYTQSEFVQNLQIGNLIKMTPIVPSVKLDGRKSGFASTNGAESYVYTESNNTITTYYLYDDTAHPTYINPSELQYWRVISKNTNGTVDVVSEYASSIGVNFYAELGYANLVGYLNELASYYENPTYTIGSRHMGYDGQTQYIADASIFDCQTHDAPSTTSTPSPTSGTGEEYSGGILGDTLYLKDYQLVENAYKGTTIGGTDGTVNAYQVGTTTITQYWLASRLYYSTSFSAFIGRSINDRGLYSMIFTSNWTPSAYKNVARGTLRPILTFKADITNTSTETGININGTTSAYVLG